MLKVSKDCRDDERGVLIDGNQPAMGLCSESKRVVCVTLPQFLGIGMDGKGSGFRGGVGGGGVWIGNCNNSCGG